MSHELYNLVLIFRVNISIWLHHQNITDKMMMCKHIIKPTESQWGTGLNPKLEILTDLSCSNLPL